MSCPYCNYPEPKKTLSDPDEDIEEWHCPECGEYWTEAAQHHMHTDAAPAAAKAGEPAPEVETVKPAGSKAAPVM